MDRAELVAKFKGLAGKIQRPGIDRLMEMLDKSDFYTAPASTKFHGAYEGGLVEHSLHVYERLASKKNDDPFWKEKLEKVDDESILISGLLHDLCKTYFYVTEMRNKKVDGQWVQVPFYTVDDKIPYGHGEKSVMMITEYIKLTPEEKYAIRWHMGFSEPKEVYGTLGQAFKKYPLALLLHEADMEATYFYNI